MKIFVFFGSGNWKRINLSAFSLDCFLLRRKRSERKGKEKNRKRNFLSRTWKKRVKSASRKFLWGIKKSCWITRRIAVSSKMIKIIHNFLITNVMINIDNDSTLCHAKTGNFPSRSPSTARSFSTLHPLTSSSLWWKSATDPRRRQIAVPSNSSQFPQLIWCPLHTDIPFLSLSLSLQPFFVFDETLMTFDQKKRSFERRTEKILWRIRNHKRSASSTDCCVCFHWPTPLLNNWNQHFFFFLFWFPLKCQRVSEREVEGAESQWMRIGKQKVIKNRKGKGFFGKLILIGRKLIRFLITFV